MTTRAPAWWLLSASLLAATVATTAACQPAIRHGSATTRSATATSATATSAATSPPTRRGPEPTMARVVIGRSRDGSPIVAEHIGVAAVPALLVVGCIHGDEPAGVPVITALAALAALARHRAVNLWLIPTMNPDGERAGTRGNAAGVDLNRNFPYQWQQIGQPGNAHWSGPHPLSEPEAFAVARLIRTARPRWAVWFHQALDLIDNSQGPRAVEHRLAVALHMREHPLTDYSGSAVGFTDHLRPHSAFVVELPGGTLDTARARQIASALLDATTALPPAHPGARVSVYPSHG